MWITFYGLLAILKLSISHLNFSIIYGVLLEGGLLKISCYWIHSFVKVISHVIEISKIAGYFPDRWTDPVY